MSVASRWSGFAAVNTAAAGALGLAGQALAGANAGAVWAGVAASLAGALVGSWPLAAELERQRGGSGKPAAAVGKATGARLLVTSAAALVAALAGRWDRKVLLFGVGAGYLALLAVETGWFLKQAAKVRKER